MPRIDARKTTGILCVAVSYRLRKIVALLLCAATVFAGFGFAGAVAAEMEHGFGIEQTDPGPPGQAPEDRACSHGCAAHLGAHLPMLAPLPGGPNPPESVRSGIALSRAAAFIGVYPDAFFRPPRISLA